jgi:hexosaminidase
VIEDGTLRANVALPGLVVRYTTDGSTPTPSSPRFTDPVEVPDDATVRLRTFDGHGRGSRTVSVSPSP